MSVYVDDMEAPYGRMRMCHMIADSHDELVAMALLIGVAPKWIQQAGTYGEHFDICKAKKALAIRRGAVLITSRELVARMQWKRPEYDRPSWVKTFVAEHGGFDGKAAR